MQVPSRQVVGVGHTALQAPHEAVLVLVSTQVVPQHLPTTLSETGHAVPSFAPVHVGVGAQVP